MSALRTSVSTEVVRTRKKPARATMTVMMALNTKSHCQPRRPPLPSIPLCNAACMKETKMLAPGYDVPKMAIRVAISEGVYQLQMMLMIPGYEEASNTLGGRRRG